MGIVIDIIIILFILASVALGYKKGLISLGIKLVAFVVAIVISLILYRPIANAIVKTTTIDEKLQQTIQVNVENFVTSENDIQITNSLVESAKKGMLPQASKELAINIIYVMTIILLYIIARICLIFVSSLADAIAKLPIINQFNKLGGSLYGLLRGVVIVYAILMIINIVISVNPGTSTNKIIQESIIAKTMINYNILNVIF